MSLRIRPCFSSSLLDLSVKAIRLRATVGEVSEALEKVFGRHRADTQKVTGVYAAAYESEQDEWNSIKADIAVNLPHPRHYTVKTSPEFMELKARLTEEIRAESLAAAAH